MPLQVSEAFELQVGQVYQVWTSVSAVVAIADDLWSNYSQIPIDLIARAANSMVIQSHLHN